MADDGDRVHVESRAEWRAWLDEHHLRDQGVWLVRFKKGHGPTLSGDDIVEEAIAFGWIDSVPQRLDDARTMLWISPRRLGSRWSRLSKQRAQRVTEAGGMTPAGQAAIDAAKADGSWSALDDVENLIVPADLGRALAAYAPARDHWNAFPPSIRRGILEWILDAKREATRRKRIAETATMAQRNERANQWSRTG